MTHLSQTKPEQGQRGAASGWPPPVEDLAQINLALDQQAEQGPTAEEPLQGLWQRLRAADSGQTPAYWLTLARLAELTLFSAAHLALAGEFTACGDLMFNPDGKLLYMRGSPRPFNVQRHQPLTQQVAHLVPPGWQAVEWLKRRTILHAPRRALLPWLRQELEGWPEPDGYLELLDADQERLAASLALLAGLGGGCRGGPREALARLGSRDRRWLDSRLYRPDLQRFHQLGRRIGG